jgi:DNA-binding response OmpR family regulator
MPARLLVVDDEALIRWSVGEQLSRAGFDVAEAADGAAALEIIRSQGAIDLAVLDLKLPDTDGLQLLRDIRVLAPACRVVMMSAYATPQDLSSARELGVPTIIPKPFDVRHLLDAVEQELARG